MSLGVTVKLKLWMPQSMETKFEVSESVLEAWERSAHARLGWRWAGGGLGSTAPLGGDEDGPGGQRGGGRHRDGAEVGIETMAGVGLGLGEGVGRVAEWGDRGALLKK